MTDDPQIDVSDMPPEVADAIHLNIAIGAMCNARYDAGYAQALRDLINHMTLEPGHVRVYAPDDIRRYAAEHGIRLEGE